VLMVVRANDEAHAAVALEAAEALLLRATPESVYGSGETPSARQPRSLEEATHMHAKATTTIAVISVPGMYAALEAQEALRAGLHVFLFSDNVSLEDEVALKRLGGERGLLVMGPDCGTALLNGVGLGFVNVVPNGPVGIVGASGTGIQQVMCLLAEAGHGISQAIGCGGRDLSAEVGGATTLQGLRLLQADKRTRVIVLISKPPAPAVAEKVLVEAASGEKPVVAIFLGADTSSWRERYAGKISFARTLTEAAHIAGALCAIGDIPGAPSYSQEVSHPVNGAPALASSVVHDLSDISRSPTSAPGMVYDQAEISQSPDLAFGTSRYSNQPPYLAALFSGGTLCDEALHIWGEQLSPVYSNIPLKPAWLWREGQAQPGHYALDLGADEYTRGRPHPMIDPEARLKYLRAAASDPSISVILLDIVLGYCAHPHPASIYAPLIQESIQQASQAGRRLSYVISLCGTVDDPQRLAFQEARLREAGAETYLSNAVAATRCLALLNGSLT
jgi:FdrA protein